MSIKKKSVLIFQLLKEYIWSEELKNQSRMSEKNFIRERILTFPVLILFLINLAKKTLQVSLNSFCNVADILSVTKQAFSKARKKLSPTVFILLNRKLIEEYYSDNTHLTWKGFRVIAVDGSDLQLPQIENLKEVFGSAKNQSDSTIAMAKFSQAYDVLNHLTLDSQIDYCKTSERDLAVKHIEAIGSQKNLIKDLYVFDRGYPSLGFLYYLFEYKKDFVIRTSVNSCFAKVKKAFNKGETDVVIRLDFSGATHQQIQEVKKRVPSLTLEDAYIDVRMVVVVLNTGEKEILLTSLLDKALHPKEEFKRLYHFRWCVEENYKWHKSALELENFSGYTELAIEQDVFSLVLAANMASILIEEAQNELEEEHKEKKLKHEYKINKRIAVATLKDKLLESLLKLDVDMESICEKLKEDLKKNLCPIRSNRKFERPKKGRQKFGCTTRRCI